MTAPADSLGLVLYEGPGAAALDGARRLDLLRALLEAGYTVACADCPCAISEAPGKFLAVLGRFERPMPPRLDQPGGATVFFRDLAQAGPGDMLELVRAVQRDVQARSPGQWVPWFPVIDYDRCNHCLQCLGFCLFGVYEAADGKVRVARPANCKTNCPACARVCPRAAIMFPKYKDRPINGAEVRPEDLAGQQVGTDVPSLLRGNVYDLLRARSPSPTAEAAEDSEEQKQ